MKMWKAFTSPKSRSKMTTEEFVEQVTGYYEKQYSKRFMKGFTISLNYQKHYPPEYIKEEEAKPYGIWAFSAKIVTLQMLLNSEVLYAPTLEELYKRAIDSTNTEPLHPEWATAFGNY